MAAELSDLTNSMVSNYIDYDSGPLIVICDDTNVDIADSIVTSANAKSPNIEENVVAVNINAWRKGNPLEKLPPDFIEMLENRLNGSDKEHNGVLYIMQSLPGEESMRGEIRDIAKVRGKIGGLPHLKKEVLEIAYHPDNIPAFSKELYDFMLKEEEVVLSCTNGSYLEIQLDNEQYDLIESNGILRPGRYGNPIPAEVFAHPYNSKGKLVITGSYGPLMGHEDFKGNPAALKAALETDPMIWKIKDSKVTDIICENTEIRDFAWREIMERDPEHGMRIGEFGLPANLYVLARELTGSLGLDEKGRVHIAHGHGYPDRTRAKYKTDVHGDGLIACANLFSRRRQLHFMKENVYNPDFFPSLRK